VLGNRSLLLGRPQQGRSCVFKQPELMEEMATYPLVSGVQEAQQPLHGLALSLSERRLRYYPGPGPFS
jgi:hypothetical protein